MKEFNCEILQRNTVYIQLLY